MEDALDRTLPAKLAPPRSPEGTAVVIIIDKSSSMEGRKIELARLAAIGVVDNLRPIDMVGVLIFDNSFQWAVPLRRAEDRPLIKRLISGITPDGGTQISPALNEAFAASCPPMRPSSTSSFSPTESPKKATASIFRAKRSSKRSPSPPSASARTSTVPISKRSRNSLVGNRISSTNRRASSKFC